MSPTTARLEARISQDLHSLLRRAAELQGRTLTDFVTETLRIAATQAVESAVILRLSLEDQERFANALLNPPEPNNALRRAFARNNQMVTR